MDDLNRSISQHIKSGRYYLDGRLWYANKFVYAISERSYVAVFVICFLIGASILGLFYSRMNPLDSEVSYLVAVPDITSQYAVINHIGNPNQSPQASLTKYMLKKYVIERKSYNFKKMTAQLAGDIDFIKNTTVATEYLKYKGYISINNPSSPVMLYQDASRIDIKVTKIELLKSDKKYSQAVVYYKSILHNFITNQTVVDDRFVNISFQIGNIEEAIDKKTLNFLVLSYNIYKTKQN
jgi:type IV secretory pathway component VirB8